MSSELDIIRLQASIDLIVFLRMLRVIKPLTAKVALDRCRWRLIVAELNQSIYEKMKNYDTSEEAIEAWLENT